MTSETVPPETVSSTDPSSTDPSARPPAILLCAGYGTRMGALTAQTPKPLLPVAGRPVLDYLLDLLLPLPSLGEVHVVSNHHYAEAFGEWAARWNRRLAERRLVVHDDGSLNAADRLGAIGDLAFVARRLGPDVLAHGALVSAGDNIFRFPLDPLWQGMLDGGETTVLALHEPDQGKLQKTGVLELDDLNRVLQLHEKPDEPPSSWACPSIYGLSADALTEVDDYLSAGHSADEIGRFLAFLVPRQTVRAVPTEGRRLHVGSPESYAHAHRELS